ncbi:MAG TPA: hypothetical protein VGR87_04550 [Candidatus Limnocylindria bacterium]|nr:hypothetical protein [Candidatus Limnocylindria bacterium]
MFARSCGSWQLPYAAAAEGLPLRDRLDLEAHAVGCPECADALRNAGPIDSALRGAFASLRERRAMLAPGRVRVALGPRRLERQAWLRAPAFFIPLAKVSVMLGVTMFVIGGSIAPELTVPPAPPEAVQVYNRPQPPFDEINYLRWVRLTTRLDPVPTNASLPTRLPDGGRFDVEPVEIQMAPTQSPR